MGGSHVQVDNTSPSSCPSTPVLFTNEGYIILNLLQLVCDVVLQVLVELYSLLCVRTLHIWPAVYYLLVVRGSCVCECVQFGVGGGEGGLEEG